MEEHLAQHCSELQPGQKLWVTHLVATDIRNLGLWDDDKYTEVDVK